MSLPPEDPPAGVPEWVVTYGDMMSLLLTFFIMLVSLSEVKSDVGALRTMLNAIHATFGPTDGIFGVPGSSTQINSAYDKMASRGMRSEGGVRKASRKSAGSGGAHQSVQRINHGTVVTLGGPAQFAPFDAALNDTIKEHLSIIYRTIADSPQRVVVRGHASPEPLPPDAPFVEQLRQKVERDAPVGSFDHFDLSFARAHAVAEYLIELGIDPQRLIVSAAGDAEPRISTHDPEAMQANHRVDVFLIDSYITRPDSVSGGRQ